MSAAASRSASVIPSAGGASVAAVACAPGSPAVAAAAEVPVPSGSSPPPSSGGWVEQPVRTRATAAPRTPKEVRMPPIVAAGPAGRTARARLVGSPGDPQGRDSLVQREGADVDADPAGVLLPGALLAAVPGALRSEEHTSEL